MNYESLYEQKNIPFQYFLSVLDSPYVIERKKQSYATIKYSDLTLENLMKQYVHYEVRSLMDTCLSLIDMSYELQDALKTSNELQKLPSMLMFESILTNSRCNVFDLMFFKASKCKFNNELSKSKNVA